MPELIATDRLQPCLLDRLTDLSPGPNSPRADAGSDRVVSMSRYRQGVFRDLEWLLNSSAHLPEEGLSEYPQVQKSVLNLGTRNLCGVLSESLNLHEYAEQLREIIAFYEPRIDPDSLTVTAVETQSADHQTKNLIAFEIHGDLWAYPLPERLWIETKVDLETGQTGVKHRR